MRAATAVSDNSAASRSRHEGICESTSSALDGKTAMKRFSLAAVLFGLYGSLAHAQWQEQTINSDADFRGLCAVSAKVAWVSGTKGTYGRTTDGGKTWSAGTVPGA